ncbi:hypothetical protein [Pelagibacterium sediminicola]|uniref:hypothetical protein n=1 Tax=Pelagibacterium sediminicola TaxID=2248761 RepID=UPI0013003D62|nr:hypothetical protein [Pelagibacterium sediminicola]
MTYLDPSHPHTRNDTIRWIVRIAFVVGLIAFGWFALTVGTDPNGAPIIVPEPAAR